jgi:hypothetical protein
MEKCNLKVSLNYVIIYFNSSKQFADGSLNKQINLLTQTWPYIWNFVFENIETFNWEYKNTMEIMKYLENAVKM